MVYLGWIAVATIANSTALLVAYQWSGFGIDPVYWSAIMIGIALVTLVFGQAGQWNPLITLSELKVAGRVVSFYGTTMNQLIRATEFGDLNHDGYNDLILTAGGQNPVVGDNTASDMLIRLVGIEQVRQLARSRQQPAILRTPR